MKILIKPIQTIKQHCQTLLTSMSCAVLITGLFAAISPASAQLQALDQVVAIVDNDVVLMSEFQGRIKQIMNNIEKSGNQAPPENDIQRQVLDQLILESIQKQKAVNVGIRISDAQLNDSLLRIAQQNNMNLQQFKAALERDGISYNTTREQIRTELMLQRLQQGSVNQQIQTSDQEIANFLASEEGKKMTAPEYRMLHTLIPLTSSSTEMEVSRAKNLADTLYQRIQRGESYQKVISEFNQYGLKVNDLGWRKANDLPSLMSDLTDTLNKGETAAPIKNSSGFHLIQMFESRGTGQVITQTSARHILLKASAIRDEAATKAEITNLRTQILNGADFAELARKFSEDIGSAAEGGDLGWTSPGQLVGAFQENMDNTNPNEISPAFKSQFGWHILQVLDRREQDVTDDIRRKIAGNYIHKRKYDDELQTWLQKIRDDAYVDIK